MFGDDEDIRSVKDLVADYRDGMERKDRLIATMQTALDVKDEKLFRLREYVEPDCRCPCCDTSMFCLDGCTLQTDEPGWCSRMMRARKAMWGTHDQ